MPAPCHYFTKSGTNWGVQLLLDMFASDHNHRLPRFWTWLPSPFAEKVDAFQQDWNFQRQGLMHCNPPWPMILCVLRKVRQDKARLVMVLPQWRGAPWWPLFLSLLQGPLLIHKGPTFLNQWGRLLRAPQWRTCFAIVNGSRALTTKDASPSLARVLCCCLAWLNLHATYHSECVCNG